MKSWEKETKERLERLGYKFDGPKTLSKNDAIAIVIKMRSKLGRYSANNRYLAEREIDYLTLVHNITYGDIWDYKKEIKKRKKQTMNFETFDQFKEKTMLNKTIMYFSQELEFKKEVETIDEAQALLDYEKRQGRTACATHYNGKHQVYSSSHEVKQ